MKLLNNAELERSWTFANSAMNRDRGLAGLNSYAKELGFSPLEFLRQRLDAGHDAAWLDLCCGNGRALRDAALQLSGFGVQRRLELVGIDLIAGWPRLPPELHFLTYQAASLHDWQPSVKFDLITCVHGLHYVGDKLGLIERAIGCLRQDGRFAAHLDLANLRSIGGDAMNRVLLKQFRGFGLTYSRRRLLLMADGARRIYFGYRYLGADDDAGPNATGQRSVNSFYEGPHCHNR